MLSLYIVHCTGITSPVVLTVVFIWKIFGLWFLLSILAVTLTVGSAYASLSLLMELARSRGYGTLAI